jgi:thioredoxin reductase (NADPH)
MSETNEKVENVIIIGSGPAGWTAAIYLGRANLSPLVIAGEYGDDREFYPGGQLMTTTEVENYPGFPNGGISGPDMMDKFQKQAEEFGARELSDVVTNIKKVGDLFKVETSDNTYMSKSVILATGARAKYLDIPGETEYLNRGVSACATCDGALPRFRNKPIVVVGGGDTAAEEALFLARFASKVYLVHRRDELRASKVMVKRVLEHEKIEMVWNTVATGLIGDDTGLTGVDLLNRDTGYVKTLECSGFFVAIGHHPNSDIVKGLVDLDEVGYIITEGKTTKTGVDGLFACGDVQDSIYRQAVTAAGSGCSAAIDCTRYMESL